MAIIEAVFAIVMVICIVGGITVNNYLKIVRENQGQLHSLEREVGVRVARIEQLEERIAVLERIVTDRRYDLEREFRNLDRAG